MKKNVLILVICVLCVIVLIFPYITAEFLTFKYGSEFNNLQQQTNILIDVEYYKVISYSNETAKVFYVSSSSGNLLTFEKDSKGNWKYSEWKTIWSNSGSADEFMWPYYH